MALLQSIDLKLAAQLRDREFRREWFRAALESDVPEIYRNLREERRKTQIEIANEAGMKQSAVSRFESSRDATWNFETLLKLADALDAQLRISLVRSEDIISHYEIEESKSSQPPTSVLQSLEGQGEIKQKLQTVARMENYSDISETRGGIAPDRSAWWN